MKSHLLGMADEPICFLVSYCTLNCILEIQTHMHGCFQVFLLSYALSLSLCVCVCVILPLVCKSNIKFYATGLGCEMVHMNSQNQKVTFLATDCSTIHLSFLQGAR